MTPPFVFDTSSIRVIGNYYPDRFPTFWTQFEHAVAVGQIKFVREVYNELEVQVQVTDKAIWDWVRERKPLFSEPTSDEGLFVADIFKVAHFRTLIGERQRLHGNPVADPFLIARAHCLKGCVVSEEKLKPGAAKIPNVCEHFNVNCTNVQGFLKAMAWKF